MKQLHVNEYFLTNEKSSAPPCVDVAVTILTIFLDWHNILVHEWICSYFKQWSPQSHKVGYIRDHCG